MKLTNQEILNKAWSHALTMKQLAKEDEGDQCMYRASNGEKCLIGSFIPDEDYQPRMELIVEDCVSNYRQHFEKWGLITALDGGFYNDNELEFLSNLQRCHDSADTLEDMFSQLRLFAIAHNLQVPA